MSKTNKSDAKSDSINNDGLALFLNFIEISFNNPIFTVDQHKIINF